MPEFIEVPVYDGTQNPSDFTIMLNPATVEYYREFSPTTTRLYLTSGVYFDVNMAVADFGRLLKQSA